jgi:hypothetical protein
MMRGTGYSATTARQTRDGGRTDYVDRPGKWQAAIVEAEQNRPKLRVVSGD